jgi:hypothetical protein
MRRQWSLKEQRSQQRLDSRKLQPSNLSNALPNFSLLFDQLRY